jgi:DNA invertase Pin-like site-specific DNA recombinase
MLDHLREGDIIVVWKLDRLARSTRDLLETMETIREADGRFQSISEPWADTTSHSGKMIMTIFAGIAEFERDLIRERTGAGREAAKKRGVRFGRPRKLALDQDELAQRLFGREIRPRDCGDF